MWMPRPTADCGAPPPPVNGSLLQPDSNTTEGSVVVFQCDPGFVPKGEMTAVCGRDGQWYPNPGHVICSPRPVQTFTEAPTNAPTSTQMSTPDEPRPGENEPNTAGQGQAEFELSNHTNNNDLCMLCPCVCMPDCLCAENYLWEAHNTIGGCGGILPQEKMKEKRKAYVSKCKVLACYIA